MLAQQDTGYLTEEAVREAVLSFLGESEQIPPMYSAVKVGGKKLYELAREGKTVERKPRKVVICQMQILEMALPRVKMEVTCSKGTYIRTLCHDIGEKLGCGGCMESLLRTRSGMFQIENSLKFDEIIRRKEEGCLLSEVLPVDQVFSDAPRVSVEAEWEMTARNGGWLKGSAVSFDNPGEMERTGDRQRVRLYDKDGHFIALIPAPGRG